MIERSSEAALDLAAHILYLRREAGAEVALRFLDSVEAALKRLEQFPHLGQLRYFRQPGLRSWPVPQISQLDYFLFAIEKWRARLSHRSRTNGFGKNSLIKFSHLRAGLRGIRPDLPK